MKSIVILNFSGNVGKSTVTHNLIAPRMNADIYAIETINDTIETEDTLKMKAEQLNDIFIQVVSRNGNADSRNMVIDVGSSNIEKVLKRLELSGGAQEDITGWVIPVSPFTKTQNDSVKTAESLIALDVPKKAIVFLRNMVESEDSMDTDFLVIERFAKKSGIKILDQFVPKLDLIADLAKVGITLEMASLEEVTNEQIQAASEDDKLSLATRKVRGRAARGAKKKLNDVFNEISATFKLGIAA